MTDATAQILRRRWQSPRTNGGLLEEPRLADAGEVAARNREILLQSSVVIDGQPLAALRARARAEAILSGRKFLKELSGGRFAGTATCCCHADFDQRVRDSLWFVSGHQPVLAHAGVWVKNIAAAVLAEKHDGLGANLIVDQDVISSRAIGVPLGPVDSPRISAVAFDEPAGARPGEEAVIGDLSLFSRFGETAAEIVRREWGYPPLIEDVWQAGVVEADGSGLLTRALSAVRISLERRHGLTNAEVELSELSRSTSFLHFFRHVAIHAEAFRDSYNRTLTDYRRVNRVRSTSHPVPDLAREGDAHEIPFWWWREGDLHRRRVFVRRCGDAMELSDGAEVFGTCSAAVSKAAANDRVVEVRAVLSDGVPAAPAVLATTLFSRLCLADLFIHGIGGAKYDEMTDALGEEFFGIEMPAYLTLTGTRWLPLGGGFPEAGENWLKLQRAVRDAQYNAEKFLGDVVDEKTRLVRSIKESRAGGSQGRAARLARRDAARRLRAVERHLASKVEHLLPELVAERKRFESQIAANRILRSREFAAVLHPMSSYREWLAQIRDAVEHRSG